VHNNLVKKEKRASLSLETLAIDKSNTFYKFKKNNTRTHKHLGLVYTKKVWVGAQRNGVF